MYSLATKKLSSVNLAETPLPIHLIGRKKTAGIFSLPRLGSGLPAALAAMVDDDWKEGYESQSDCISPLYFEWTHAGPNPRENKRMPEQGGLANEDGPETFCFRLICPLDWTEGNILTRFSEYRNILAEDGRPEERRE